MAILRKISDRLERVLWIVGASFLVVGAIIMVMEIFSRNIWAVSLIWAEEFTRYLTIWAVFLLAGPLVKHGVHVRVVALYTRLSPSARRRIGIFICCLGVVLCLLCAVWGSQFMAMLIESKAKSITGTPLHPWTWQLPLIVGLGIAVFYFCEHLIFVLKGGEFFGQK